MDGHTMIQTLVVVPVSAFAEVGAVIESEALGSATHVLDVGYSQSGNLPISHYAFCGNLTPHQIAALSEAGALFATFDTETGVLDESGISTLGSERNAPEILASVGLRRVGQDE